jgi:oligopeptide transport system permease protein
MSYLGPTAASILSGSVVIEKVFSFPGIGTHTVSAATNRDYSMILALVIIYSIVLITCNTIIDIIYCYLDPKIKIR